MRFVSRKKPFVWICWLALIPLLSLPTAWGEEWKYYSTNEHFFCFYDPTRIVRPSPEVVQVWLKWLATPEGIHNRTQEMVQRKIPREAYETYETTQVLMEMNCRDRTYMVLSLSDFNEKGREISAGSKACYLREFTKAFPILKNTSEEELHAILCTPKERSGKGLKDQLFQG